MKETNIEEKSTLVKVLDFRRNLKKAIVKKLNNFRTTSFIISGLAILSVLVALGLILFYSFAGTFDDEIKLQNTAFIDRPIAGMMFFLSGIFAIIAGIVVVYLSIKPIANNDLFVPKKGSLIATLVSGFFHLIASIFTIILIATTASPSSPNYEGLEVIKFRPGFIVLLVFSLLIVLASAFMILPLKSCEFYMPPIRNKEKKSK